MQWLQCLSLLYQLRFYIFFSNFWNLLDIVNLSLFMLVMIFRIVLINETDLLNGHAANN